MQTLSRDMVARCTGVGSILFAECIAGLLPAVSFGADVENTAPIAALTDVLAVSSEAFLSSLGVVTFLDQGADPNSYIAPLHYTGIRNIRDGVRNLSGSILLHEKIGVQVNLLGADVTNMIAAAKALATRDALLSLEGPNEPNNFPIQYNGKTGGSLIPSFRLSKCYAERARG